MATPLVFVPLLLLGVAIASSVALPSVSPARNYTVSSISADNVTYICKADVGTVFWALNQRQIQGSKRLEEYEERQIFIDDTMEGKVTTLTVTPHGRQFLVKPIRVECYEDVSIGPGAKPGDAYFIEVFDAPSPPGGLQLNYQSDDQLILQWKRPLNLSDNVNVTYHVEVTSGDTIQRKETVATYILINQTVEETCQPHSFTVTARNDAGNSSGTSIQESIPISPGVIPINDSQKVEQVLLFDSTRVNITISFEPATNCSTQFPVLNYTVSIEGLEGGLTIEDASAYSSALSVVLSSSAFPELVQDQQYSITITACTNFTCRSPPDALTVVTTDVQSASAVFYERTVSLNCTFATGSSATGCLFVFPLTNEDSTENSTILHTGRQAFNMSCVQLSNTRAAYGSPVLVYGIGSDNATVSLSVVANVTVETEIGSFPCPPPSAGDDEKILSTGAIVGIVVPFLLLCILLLLCAGCVKYLCAKKNTIEGKREIKRDAGAEGKGQVKSDDGAEDIPLGDNEREGTESSSQLALLLSKDPVASIEMKSSKDPDHFKLIPKISDLSRCVGIWRDNAPNKRLNLYCKLDEP